MSNYGSQLTYTGKGYLDGKMQPVATLADLNYTTIPRAQRFIGLTITVLDDGTGQGPRDYWLKEKVSEFVPKYEGGSFSGIIDCGEY